MDSSGLWTRTPLRSNAGGDNSWSRCQMSGWSSPCKTPVRGNNDDDDDDDSNDDSRAGKVSKMYSVRRNVIHKMPVYSSPPTEKASLVKNPFEHARLLRERLSQPFCSPSLFEKRGSLVKDDQFNWTIEEISHLRPAPINENPSQEFDSWFSPVTESEAQKAINKFFSSQIVNMESPIDVRASNRARSERRETADTWSQTVLSFPPDLPPDVEEILALYCNLEGDECNQGVQKRNSSNSIIRRKKLFDSIRDDADSVCGTPIQRHNQCKQQAAAAAASTPISRALASPELSPIKLDKFQDSPMDVSVSCKSMP